MKVNYLIYIALFLLIPVLLLSCRNNVRDQDKKPVVIDEETLISTNRYIIQKEIERIGNYVERRGWDMDTTRSGLWYMIIKEGTGTDAVKGKIATIEYKISLLDGTVCYSSEQTGPKQFTIGSGGVESGLEEGILLLNEGAEAIFILPPYLAHGFLGDENKIPRGASLVYYLRLKKVKGR
ncbi:MAG: FKBP-type peptidyl-prolyl cis-trans isomerase [Bacteroidetes bacterium]|nr:FKBP-type peptidyl-prolyl cis-trans isomerase [Bacteroidota bacterium]